MIRSRSFFRNSLISLVAGLVSVAAWAQSPPAGTSNSTGNATSTAAPVTGQNLNVPIHDSEMPPRPRALDLKPPDIRSVMSQAELAALIPDPDEIQIVDDETVQVHGGTPAPYVPSGFAALYWGVTHPTSAWRILAPVQ